MASYSDVQKLNKLEKTFLRGWEIASVLHITNKRTLENTVKRLVDGKVLTYLEKDKYFITEKRPNDFEIAQFLYSPSYISFETALSYHGILPQFPLLVTSATTKRTKEKRISEKDYQYSHLSPKLFTGFYKEGNALIAFPEKALVDQIYLSLKGYKSALSFDEFHFERLDKSKVLGFINPLSKGLSVRAISLVEKYL